MKEIIKRLDNFWYHYKWIVLITAFFAAAVIIMLVQFFAKDSYDAVILYTGPELPSANETRDIENAIESVMSEDYDGDGDRKISLNPLFLLTDEQLEDKKYTVDEEGNTVYINTSEMVNTRQQFTTQIFVGESLICLLDPNWYELAHAQDAFLPLSEIFSAVPDCAYDECSLYLKDTEFGQYFTAMKALPEDTLLCFRRMPSSSALKNEKKEAERYEFNKRLFKDIVEFSLKK